MMRKALKVCFLFQVASMRMKVSSTPTNVNTLDQSMEENISIICEGVGLGAKRRSDYSPSKENHLFGIGKSFVTLILHLISLFVLLRT